MTNKILTLQKAWADLCLGPDRQSPQPARLCVGGNRSSQERPSSTLLEHRLGEDAAMRVSAAAMTPTTSEESNHGDGNITNQRI